MPVIGTRKARVHYGETFSDLKRITRVIFRLRKEINGQSIRKALCLILTKDELADRVFLEKLLLQMIFRFRESMMSDYYLHIPETAELLFESSKDQPDEEFEGKLFYACISLAALKIRKDEGKAQEYDGQLVNRYLRIVHHFRYQTGMGKLRHLLYALNGDEFNPLLNDDCGSVSFRRKTGCHSNPFLFIATPQFVGFCFEYTIDLKFGTRFTSRRIECAHRVKEFLGATELTSVDAGSSATVIGKKHGVSITPKDFGYV